MLSRRSLFTLGLGKIAERVEEQYDLERLNPSPPKPPKPPARPARPAGVPLPRAAWPHRRGAELWESVSEALPRPEGANVLEVDELETDLARMPFADGGYDGAVSAFAPMFSSDGRLAIEELFRVVRPGGTVAFTSWTPAGIVGRLLSLAQDQEPPNADAPSPLAWGREDRLRGELERHSDDFELRPGGLTLNFDSREAALDALFMSLRPLAWARDQPALRELAAELIGPPQGPVSLRATYVMVVAEARSG
jgi:SAM-dependent methyltransferase